MPAIVCLLACFKHSLWTLTSSQEGLTGTELPSHYKKLENWTTYMKQLFQILGPEYI